MADIGYQAVANTTTTQVLQHNTVAHSFFHDGVWWQLAPTTATNWNLYAESGNIPSSPGAAVDWTASAELSAVVTTPQCSVALDVANGKAFVIGFNPGGATVQFRVLTYISGSWSVTQSFNLTNSAGVGLGTVSPFENHTWLSVGCDPNGVPYVVAGNKGASVDAVNGIHFAYPNNPASLGGTWSYVTVDPDLPNTGDYSGKFAGIVSQGGTDYIVLGYVADTGSGGYAHRIAYHAVETTMANYASGWVEVDVDTTVTGDNHCWAGVMSYGGEQVVVIAGKDDAASINLFTSQLGAGMTWTHKRHKVTRGTASGVPTEDTSRPVCVLDSSNGVVHVVYQEDATNPEGAIYKKSATLADLLAASSDTSVFDTTAADSGDVVLWDESMDRMLDPKTPSHPVTEAMGYAPVTAMSRGVGIWWAAVDVPAPTGSSVDVAVSSQGGMSWAASGAVSATVIQPPVTASVGGAAAMAWAASGNLFVTPLQIITVDTAGMATMLWSVTGINNISNGARGLSMKLGCYL